MFIFGLIMIALFIVLILLVVKSIKNYNRKKSNVEKLIDEEIKKGK